MDISSGSVRSHDATCAFPSWPRRSSLDSEDTERPTAFLSDDDLLGDPFEDDATSTTSSASGSMSCSPQHQPAQPTEEELFYIQRERMNMERQLVQHIITEKERRRQANKAAAAAAHASDRRRSSPKKTAPKSKVVGMTPIAE
jgi:hypothetical protein